MARTRTYSKIRVASRALALASILTGVALPASSQDVERLLREWLATQREAVAGVASVTLDETTRISVDGGFGRQTLVAGAVRTVGPSEGPGSHEIVRMELNGSEIAFERGERFRRQQRGLWRPEIGRMMESFRFPVRDFGRMRMARAVMDESPDGRAAWRIDVVPRAMPDPVERMTAWFEPAEFRLILTESILRAPSARPVRVRTWYERFRGIDMPVEVRAEGSSRMRRRMRFFTTLFEIETIYSSHAVDFVEP